MPKLINSLHSELRHNLRAQIGVALIVAIALYATGNRLKQSADLATQQQVAQARDLQRLLTVDTKADWAARLDEALGAKNRAYDGLWREPTLSLAQARIVDTVQNVLNLAQQELVSTPRRAQVQSLAEANSSAATAVTQPNTPSTADDSARFWRVRVKFVGELTPGGLDAVMALGSRPGGRIELESLDLRKAPPRMEGVLVAYFLKPGGAP